MKYMWLLLLSCVTLQAALSPAESERLCREAEELFCAGNDALLESRPKAEELWRKSTLRLERAISEGQLSNGVVFYNLGNTYFRLGDLGRAILNYRRAQRFIPTDSNLKRNLAFAKRKCRDDIPEKEETRILKTLFFWHYEISLANRQIITWMMLSLLLILGSLRIYLHPSWLNWSLATVGCLLLVLGASISITYWDELHHPRAVIIAAAVEAHSGNSAIYEKSFDKPLHAGTEVTLLEQRGAWVAVQLDNGQQGWLPAKALQPIHLSL